MAFRDLNYLTDVDVEKLIYHCRASADIGSWEFLRDDNMLLVLDQRVICNYTAQDWSER